MVVKAVGVGILLVFVLVNLTVAAETIDVTKDVKEAQQTIAVFKKADPGLSRFFDNAVGYAVFPTVVKGAVGVGGASGSGIVFEKGKAVGRAALTQATIGAQIGGQTYSEVIFFETVPAFSDFKRGKLALAAQASAVAASADASKNVKYQDGVAIFTIGKGGLMAEASVGGQKFSFEPLEKK
jgi:lipid-binding SYLF domain-containing protein